MKAYDLYKRRCSYHQLAIALFNPFAQHMSEARLTMYDGQMSQAIPFLNGQMPFICTPHAHVFNSLTRWNVTCPISGRVHRVYANKNRYVLFVINDSEVWAVEFNRYKPSSEIYGITRVDLTEGAEYVTAGDVVIAAPWCTTDSGKYHPRVWRPGMNLRCLTGTYYDLTHQDSIVMSEEVIETMKYPLMETFTINLKKDQRLRAMFGGRVLPDIGEKLTSSIVAELTDISILGLPDTDTLLGKKFHTVLKDGRVVDVQSFCGETIENQLPGNMVSYWVELKEFFEQDGICSRKLIGDAGFIKWHADIGVGTDSLSTQFSYNKQPVDNALVKIIVAADTTPGPGTKFTGIGGNKNVLSILPAKDMPIDEFGNRIDAIAFTHSIPSRNIIGVQVESELNALSEFIVRKLRAMKTKTEKFELLSDYYQNTQCSHQADLIRSRGNGASELLETVERDGIIQLFQQPYDGITGYGLFDLYDRYDFKPARIYFKFPNKDGVLDKSYPALGNIVAGYQYTMVLRHEPAAKMSVRSANALYHDFGSGRDRTRTNGPFPSAGARFGEYDLMAAWAAGNAPSLAREHQSGSARVQKYQALIDTAAATGATKIDLMPSDIDDPEAVSAVRALMLAAGIAIEKLPTRKK